jgi:hypothetical protein
MKRIFCIVLLFVPLLLYGQEHLQFMGHPITGSLNDFVKALKTDGFESSTKKYKFKGMKTKTLKGRFWDFTECHIAVRQPSKYENVTSLYIHPLSKYVLLEELIDAFDSKYGHHTEVFPKVDVNAVIYSWNLPEGCIQIFASVIYGQAFDIVYRDYTEVRLLNYILDTIDRDL